MNIVRVFEQSDVSQGIQFFDDPTGLSDFAVPVGDLADCLGLEVKGLSNLISDEYLCLSDSQPNLLLAIEFGVYEALTRTRSKVAKPFQKWLFAEVLPAIRKTGEYSTKPKFSRQEMLAVTLLRDNPSKAEAILDAMQEAIGKDKPKLVKQAQPATLAAIQQELEADPDNYSAETVFFEDLEAICLDQIDKSGEIRVGRVLAQLNLGRDPKTKKSRDWVVNNMESLLCGWNYDWKNYRKLRAVHWSKVD